jgi:hypothetical protein
LRTAAHSAKLYQEFFQERGAPMAKQLKPKKPARPLHPPIPRGFSRAKSIETLAKEQGVPLQADFDDLLGMGNNLWRSDEEFEAFLAWLKASRQHGR